MTRVTTQTPRPALPQTRRAASSPDAGPSIPSGGLEAMWRDLGRQLAALRREARLTQQALAAQIRFSRTTVSMAETGRYIQGPEFWQACDKALRTGGVLAAGAQQVRAARKAGERAAARAAQEAREARALAAFAAARDHRGVLAGVSAVQSCPNCGCEVMILTTLIPGSADAAPGQPAHAAGILANAASR
jgi:DNA-binding XRE family transcriptional regulator